MIYVKHHSTIKEKDRQDNYAGIFLELTVELSPKFILLSTKDEAPYCSFSFFNS